MWPTILFDLDGTLTDPKTGITKSVQFALAHFGIHVENPDVLCPFIGPPLLDSFRDFYGFSETDAKTAIAQYREYFSAKGIYENAVYDGIPALLQALKTAGRRIVLATSKPTIFANLILKHFAIDSYFDFVSGSELDGTRTHKAEVIAYALQQCQLHDTASLVMVGDRKHDIIGAQQTDLASIGVLYGYGSREELCAAGATMLADTVRDLSALLL